MSFASPITTINHAPEICRYFEWHLRERRALFLIGGAGNGPLPAFVHEVDVVSARVEVTCTGLHIKGASTVVPCAVIGSSPSGASFLASSHLRGVEGTSDCFSLLFPTWIDVSQSRDSYRSLAPGGHYLHLSRENSQNEVAVCRVHNLSLGGLAVEWEPGYGSAPPVGSIVEGPVLRAKGSEIQMGRLRVVHISPKGHNSLIGFQFEQKVPRSFDLLVLDAQRAEYTAHVKS